MEGICDSGGGESEDGEGTFALHVGEGRGKQVREERGNGGDGVQIERRRTRRSDGARGAGGWKRRWTEARFRRRADMTWMGGGFTCRESR